MHFSHFVHLGIDAAMIYASSAGVDLVIAPEGETRISFSIDLEGKKQQIQQTTCPPNDEPIRFGRLISRGIEKIFLEILKRIQEYNLQEVYHYNQTQ